MRRVILDTNIYIDWINDRRHDDVLFQSDAVAYLSAIVVMELYAGAFTERDRRLIRKLLATSPVRKESWCRQSACTRKPAMS